MHLKHKHSLSIHPFNFQINSFHFIKLRRQSSLQKKRRKKKRTVSSRCDIKRKHSEKEVLSWQEWNMLSIKMSNKSQGRKKIYVDKIQLHFSILINSYFACLGKEVFLVLANYTITPKREKKRRPGPNINFVVHFLFFIQCIPIFAIVHLTIELIDLI